jgi:adenine phosphoribosyltransferase
MVSKKTGSARASSRVASGARSARAKPAARTSTGRGAIRLGPHPASSKWHDEWTLPAIARPASSFDYCRSLIRDVPDFPTPGIMFKDITPLLASPRALHIVLDGIAERFIGEHIDAIVGIEARGFIFGGALAARLNASFVPVRKPGKLPAEVDRVELVTEYSRDALEMHKKSLPEGARVVVVDDVLATGGTASAAAALVHKQGGYVIGHAFVVELTALGGRERLLPARVEACIAYPP